MQVHLDSFTSAFTLEYLSLLLLLLLLVAAVAALAAVAVLLALFFFAREVEVGELRVVFLYMLR